MKENVYIDTTSLHEKQMSSENKAMFNTHYDESAPSTETVYKWFQKFSAFC